MARKADPGTERPRCENRTRRNSTSTQREERFGRKAFATCPVTENGLLRIVGHRKYPKSPGPPSTVTSALRALPGHEFWPDSISLADSAFVDASPLSSHSRVTDSYLLALARANKRHLATLNHQLATESVYEGKTSLALI